MQLETLQYQSDHTRRDRGDSFGSEDLEAGHLEYSSHARYYRPEHNPKINQISAVSRNISLSSSSITSLPPCQRASPTYSSSYPVDQVNGYESERGKWPIYYARSPTNPQISSFLIDHGERTVYSPASDGEGYINIPLPESRPGSAIPRIMNRSYSSFLENGHEAMRPSSRAGLSSPSLSQPQSPYLGVRPGTAFSVRAGNKTPSSPTIVQKSYPPLSRPGTAITRDDLSGSRQPSFRRAQTPRFGSSGTRAQQAAVDGGIPPPSPATMSSLPSSPRLETADSLSVRGQVSSPFEPNNQHLNEQPTWYNGVSSPTMDSMGSLRVGRNRGWSNLPSLSRSGSHGDDTYTVPLVLRPGIPQP